MEVDALLPAGPRITILLVGGAALAVHWGDRLSMDVDIVAPDLPDEVLDGARAVAAKHGIAETWLENPYDVAPEVEPAADLVASGQRLDIHVPCLEYILAMKLYAARLKDAADTARLICETGLLSRMRAQIVPSGRAASLVGYVVPQRRGATYVSSHQAG